MTEFSSFEPLFKRWGRGVALSADDKRAVASLPWQRKSYAREAYLGREGETPTSCTLLLHGLAFRHKLVSDGARQIVSFHIPGEFLDLQDCLLEVTDHNLQALSRCTVAAVHKDALVELMAERPAVRRAVWLDTLIDASVFSEWVVNLGRRNARQRIAHLLCELAARLRAADASDGSMYDFPVTQEQIADATGLTPVHTNRTLQSLRRSGLINLTSNKLTILDWDALAEVGGFSDRYLHHSVERPAGLASSAWSHA